ncbi:hypothetical protein NDU88_002578 [Pleurodeles waltl]|uniref:Uncharacterized protein n=1 Tax=Pleurodeles waltl TaxID=8319 RepID=A0AAV7W2J8_PLEWA|nr:hypothetical protein NDU88_002578 [Pleurodeles waltl]
MLEGQSERRPVSGGGEPEASPAGGADCGGPFGAVGTMAEERLAQQKKEVRGPGPLCLVTTYSSGLLGSLKASQVSGGGVQRSWHYRKREDRACLRQGCRNVGAAHWAPLAGPPWKNLDELRLRRACDSRWLDRYWLCPSGSDWGFDVVGSGGPLG